jgi:hypothetical protein
MVVDAVARMGSQWLADRPGRTVAAVAAHLCGLQAQDTAAARLAVRARSATLTADAVRRAGADGSVVRTWLMRGTLHLVAATDVRWLVGLFGDRNRRAGGRRRAQLGLDDAVCTRALGVIADVLADGPLPRAALVERVIASGLPVDPSGQAPAHLMAYAANSGLVCRGPDLDGDEPGYVLLDPWVAGSKAPDDPLAELTRRYLGAFGPAGPADLAAWSGLPLGVARDGFAAVGVDTPAPAAGAPDGPVVRLLGAYDTYLLGYRDRTGVLAAADAKRIVPGGGVVHPAVVRDGRVVGRWRLRRDTVEVEPFDRLDDDTVALLEAEAADLGRFLGRPVGLA